MSATSDGQVIKQNPVVLSYSYSQCSCNHIKDLVNDCVQQNVGGDIIYAIFI